MITRQRQKEIAQELEGLDLTRRPRELYDELYPDFVPFADFHDVVRHVRMCRETGEPFWPEDEPTAEVAEPKPAAKPRKKSKPEATEDTE